MNRLVRVMLVLTLTLAFTSPVFAQGIGVQDSDGHLASFRTGTTPA